MTVCEKQLKIREFLIDSFKLLQEAKKTTCKSDKIYIIIEIQKVLSYVVCWSTNLPLQYFNHYSQWVSMAAFNPDHHCSVLEKFIIYYLGETKK